MKKGSIVYVGIVIIIFLLCGFLFFRQRSSVDGFYTKDNIDIPTTSTYGCSNMCGPNGSCLLTGEDCYSDRDCHGCTYTKRGSQQDAEPDSDAGKLSFNGQVYPYSRLTHDIGSQAALLSSSDKFTKPPRYNQGVNQWRHSYDVGYGLFLKRYSSFMEKEGSVSYPVIPTVSGEFAGNNPTSSNNYLH